MQNEKMENLIIFALADGELNEKERAIEESYESDFDACEKAKEERSREENKKQLEECGAYQDMMND